MLAVGLIGAGPWAELVHAPVLAAGPETRLAGVWARRPEAAATLAQAHGAQAYDDADALIAASDVVAFAVPPAVQGELAIRAARAGKPLLLEKPLSDTLAGAEAVVAAIEQAGVPALVTLTYRYAAAVRAWLGEVAEMELTGGRGCFLSNAYLGGPFATPWRLEHGSLLDVGPHMTDLLDAALGPIVCVHAHRSGDWTGLLLDHDGGARSELTLCAKVAVEPLRIELEVLGPQAASALDVTAGMGPEFVGSITGPEGRLADAEAFATLRRELAETVASGRPHALGPARALHLQRVVAAAVESIGSGVPVEVAQGEPR